MALFGEKYGEVVRMVEVADGGYSRELCGGTHVRSTAEIGAMRILSETSSAANVRRIEALTGPAAVELLREHDRLLDDVARALRSQPRDAPEVAAAHERERRELQKQLQSARAGGEGPGALDIEALAAQARELDGATVLAARVQVDDGKALLDVADRLKGKLSEAAIALGTASEGRAHLLVSVAPALVSRGVRAGEVVKAAAEVVGGGGGGRDTLAQAGGREPEKLDAALEKAEAAILSALQS
jgi:alanyl-tRNA synthetase